MIKKIDEALNWILVGLFIMLAVVGCYYAQVAALIFGVTFIVAIVVRMIRNKKESNIVKFKRKE